MSIDSGLSSTGWRELTCTSTVKIKDPQATTRCWNVPNALVFSERNRREAKMTEGDADTADPDDMAIDPLPAVGPYYRVGTTRRLVVVSNRVPPTGDAKPDSGGLAVAIRSALQDSGGVWFGWSGEVAEQPTDEPGITVDGPLTFATLDLSRRDYDEYYIGYANRVLWPLFHYRAQRSWSHPLDQRSPRHHRTHRH
jgi:hypothetical protein